MLRPTDRDELPSPDTLRRFDLAMAIDEARQLDADGVHEGRIAQTLFERHLSLTSLQAASAAAIATTDARLDP